MFIMLSFTGNTLAQTIHHDDLANASRRPSGNFDRYVDENGNVYAVGDTLQIAQPSGINGQFVYLNNNSFFFVANAVLPEDEADFRVGPQATNTKTVIRRIRVVGSRRSGWKVSFRTTGFTGFDSYFFNIEDAVSSGEVKGKGMSSDEALAELKRAKTKLDLELITRDEYDEIKEELRIYID